jgi:hypothetical protein
MTGGLTCFGCEKSDSIGTVKVLVVFNPLKCLYSPPVDFCNRYTFVLNLKPN